MRGFRRRGIVASVRRTPAVVVAVAIALATGACGARVEVLGFRFGEECPVVARPLSSSAVAEEDANVHLFVTNQSFEDPVVRVAVTVDGGPVVDQDFHVCGQHEWVSFPLRLQPGWHDVVVTTPTGIRTESRLDVPGGPGERWVVVSHWNDPDPRVDVEVHTEQVGFA